MRPGEFEVGQLYLGEYRNGLKVWDQPTPGGLVFPQLPTQFNWFGDPEYNGPGSLYQWPMEYSAMYFLGCGHPSNCLEIYQYFNPYTEQLLKLICCGQCSFIQEILTVEQYQSSITTPIVVA